MRLARHLDGGGAVAATVAGLLLKPTSKVPENIYHLDGLVQRVQALEPDFAKKRAVKKAWRDARKDAELSPHLRRSKPKAEP